jgi:regulator of protease activity HflC (stomatin/prohibitin superfamily)
MSDAPNINRSTERAFGGIGGGLPLLSLPVLLAAAVWAFSMGGVAGPVLGAALIVLFLLVSCGFYSLQPNEAYVVTLFGTYVGTDRRTGLRWVLFWYGRKKISLRVRNVTSETLKVNDKRGNPSRSPPTSSGGCRTPPRPCSTSTTTSPS